MNIQHPTEQDLYLHAAGEEPLTARAENHVAHCDECGRRLAGLRQVIASLGELSASDAPPAELTERLRAEIGSASAGSRPAGGRRAPWVSTALRIAAAIVIFAAGLAVGNGGKFSASPETTEVRTIDVQRAGTDYVASLASLAAASAELSPPERRQLREVTLAAMSGAAFELRRLAGDDSVTARLYRATQEAWLGTPSASDGGRVER